MKTSQENVMIYFFCLLSNYVATHISAETFLGFYLSSYITHAYDSTVFVVLLNVLQNYLPAVKMFF